MPPRVRLVHKTCKLGETHTLDLQLGNELPGKVHAFVTVYFKSSPAPTSRPIWQLLHSGMLDRADESILHQPTRRGEYTYTVLLARPGDLPDPNKGDRVSLGDFTSQSYQLNVQ
jgi:hypothetical protein